MNSLKKALLSILYLFLFSLPSPAQQKHLADKIKHARLILDSIIQSGDYVGLSAAVTYKGKIVLADGFGYKNLDKKIKPDENTLFRIYSISKGLAGLLALKLVEEGKLDLDQPIGGIIPDLPDHLHAITPKQLLAHLSGIRHYNGWEEWNAISQDHCSSPFDALEVFIKDTLLFEPGEKVSYTSRKHFTHTQQRSPTQRSSAPFGPNRRKGPPTTRK